MNENENDKKPEEGEDAAPVTPEIAPESVSESANATSEPAAEATPEPEAAAPEAPAEDTAPEATPEPAPELEPEPAPEAAAEPETPADPEAQPVAAMFAEPVADSAPVETAPADTADAPDTPAGAEEQSSFAWATQPMVEPDPGAGAEAVAATEEPEAEPEPQPLCVYEYRFIRVKQNTWDTVEAAVLSAGAAAAAEAGGQLFGIWAGQIGLSANQGIVVTVWTDLDAAKRNGKSAINGISEVSASETLYMEPTTRPVDATPPEGPGIFAHRIFETRREDTDRFVELSDEAWPQFEEVFGTKIFALWRETGHDRAFDRLILLTRYADYAAWENSRFWRPEPDPNASDALEKFRERRQITVDTVVYTTRLGAAASSG